MTKNDHIFIDTSMFKALVDPKDTFHKQARSIWERLGEKKIWFVTSNFIIDETLTLLRYKCGLRLALRFRELIVTNAESLRIVRIKAEDEANAWEWFEKDWSKLSFTDCVSFAIMKRLGIKRVATFDEDFSRAGFSIESSGL